MDDFEKSQIIHFDRHDTGSIRQALQQYQQLLDDEQAFSDDEFHRCLDVAFMDTSGGEPVLLKPNEVHYGDLVVDAVSLTPDGPFTMEELCSRDDYYLSEPILFALALEHDDLKGDVRNTAQAIVNHARRYNDTNDMWLDDMRVFGAEALYVMARLDSADAFYLAQFFIPYWDDEHCIGYENMLFSLTKHYGWCDDMIKAFVWCDSEAFRFGFYGCSWEFSKAQYLPLGEYLKANPDIYPRFQQLIRERFAAQPMLAQHDDEDDLEKANPVLWIYRTLFPEFANPDEADEEALLGQHFIHDTLENEAMDWQSAVHGDLYRPLMTISENARREQEEYRAYEERQLKLQRFLGGINMINEFLRSFEESKALIHYTRTGEGRDVLERLPDINLWTYSKTHAPTLYDVIDSACWNRGSHDNLRENLHKVLEYPAHDLLHKGEYLETEFENGMISRVRVVPDHDRVRDVINAGIMVRIVEIFHHLLGKKPLPEEVCALLTEHEDFHPVLTREGFLARFDPDGTVPVEEDSALSRREQRQLVEIVDRFENMDEYVDRDLLERVDTYFSRRELIDTRLWPEPSLGTDCLAAYLLHNDFHNRVGDAQTEALHTRLQEGVFRRALDLMLRRAQIMGEGRDESVGFSPEDMALIRNYFSEAETGLDQAAMIALLNQHLHRDDINRRTHRYFPKLGEQQIGYHFLSDFDDDYQRVVLICFWLKQLPLPEGQVAKRLWQLLVAMAPTKMIRHLSRLYSIDDYDVEFDDVLQEIEFYELMNRHGIDQAYTDAFQVEMLRYDSGRIGSYHGLVERIGDLANDDSSMFKAADRRRAEALLRGIEHIPESIRIDYLNHGALLFPEQGFLGEQHFRRALDIFIQLNSHGREEVLAQHFKSALLYKGTREPLPKNLQLPVRLAGPEALQPLKCEDFDWIDATLLQRQGDELVLLRGEWPEVPTAEQLAQAGRLIVFDDSIEGATLLESMDSLPPRQERDRLLGDDLWAYLNGDMGYDDIAPRFHACLSPELDPDLDNYRTYTLAQFLWCIDAERRERLVCLLANHSHSGYKVIHGEVKAGYLDQQVREGKMDLMARLDEYEDDHETAAFNGLMGWLRGLSINRFHLVLFAIEYPYSEMEQFLEDMANSGELKPLLPQIYPDKRATLVEILGKRSLSGHLLAIFDNDRSRKVQDRVKAVRGY